MTHRSKPAGIFADPRDGIMVRFENNRVRKITSAERLVVVACLAALHSTSAAGETTSSDGGKPLDETAGGFPVAAAPYQAEETGVISGTRQDPQHGTPHGSGVTGGESAATIPADVLAMKEACKRAVRHVICASDWPPPDGDELIDGVLAAIDKLSPEVKAESGRDEPVAIKPLEWRDHRPDSFPEPAWSAQTPFGYYNIEEVSASDSPAYVVRLHNHHFIADKDSLEDARGAAQADYEQRIRSALVIHPASEAIAERLTKIRCWLDVQFNAIPNPNHLSQKIGELNDAIAALLNGGRPASAIRTGGQKK